MAQVEMVQSGIDYVWAAVDYVGEQIAEDGAEDTRIETIREGRIASGKMIMSVDAIRVAMAEFWVGFFEEVEPDPKWGDTGYALWQNNGARARPGNRGIKPGHMVDKAAAKPRTVRSMYR